MLITSSAFEPFDGSISTVTDIQSTDALIPPPFGCGAAQQGELSAPMQKCANGGRRNAGLTYDLSEYECNSAPILWPKYLDEDTGRVQIDWAKEMFKIRADFWKPIGALLLWRWVEYSAA
jgi:hypothetical protein